MQWITLTCKALVALAYILISPFFGIGYLLKDVLWHNTRLQAEDSKDKIDQRLN